MPTEATLLPLVQKSFELNPSVTAHTIEALDIDEAANVLKALPADMAAKVIQQLNDALAADLLQRLPYPLFRAIIENLDSQQGASIFFHFPDHLRISFCFK